MGGTCIKRHQSVGLESDSACNVKKYSSSQNFCSPAPGGAHLVLYPDAFLHPIRIHACTHTVAYMNEPLL